MNVRHRSSTVIKAFLVVTGVLVSLPARSQPATIPPTPAPSAASASPPAAAAPGSATTPPGKALIKREWIELRLETVPVSRVSCTLRTNDPTTEDDETARGYSEGQRDPSGETKTIQWDPESNQPLTRTVRVPQGREWWLYCGSEPFVLAQDHGGARGGGQLEPTRAFHYRIAKPKQEKKACHRRLGDKCRFSRMDLSLVDVVSGNAAGEPIFLTATLAPMVEVPMLPGNELTQIATDRSVVDFDEVLNSLATGAAEVAVERARSTAEALIQERIAQTFCEDLTLGALWKQVDTKSGLDEWLAPVLKDGAASKKSCSSEEPDLECKRPLLPNTCKAARGVRVSDMAASGEVIQRAVTSDLTALVMGSFARLGGNQATDKGIGHAVDIFGSLLTSVMLSDVDLTEKQAQSLLFSLANATGALQQQLDWRDAVQLSVAVTAECLQQGECSSDQLQRALTAELKSYAAEAKRQLPAGLVAFALGVRDVLRPAQGTPPRATVARALQVSLTALSWAFEERLTSQSAATKRARREQVQLLRSLVGAMESERYGAAIQLAGGLLADLIRRDCERQGSTCQVAVTSKQAEKWFGVLGAFASYAGSYASSSKQDLGKAELAKYQAEQRKEAMRDLIDAATDRRDRGRDVVLSVGIGVHALYGMRTQFCEEGQDCGGRKEGRIAGASLPTGLALEWLPPDEGFPIGLHGQLSVLDLGQFAGVAGSNVAVASPATPIYLGAQLGVLIGGPKYNLLLAVDAGYAPGMDFDKDNVKVGGWRVGGVAGMYVPFLDLN